MSILRLRSLIRGAQLGRKRRRGQALTEFALVVPIMVTLLLFSIYFYEVIQIRLKAQEVARYTTWEFTGYPLHDYGQGSTDGFGQARGEILADVAMRYANLKSGTPGTQSSWLMTGWVPPVVMPLDTPEPTIPGGSITVGGIFSVNTIFTIATTIIDLFSALSFTHANPVLMLMMGINYVENKLIVGARANRFNPPRRWAFNKKGYVKTRVMLRYRNLLIPQSFMEKSSQGGWYKSGEQSVRHFQARQFMFRESMVLLADSWKLHYGDNVEGTRSSGTAYYKQVDRMAFVSNAVKGVVRGFATFIQLASGLVAFAAFHPPLTVDPLETALVSKAYTDKDSGKIRINEDKTARNYDTSPMLPGSEYEKSLDSNYRGENYMGCHDPEKLGCFDSLSSDNPFGDFVAPPP